MNLNYKVFGQGHPVIILHGLFGSLDNWQTIAKQLASDFTVFLVDQRNHGKSPHTPEINYALLADDLHEWMESQHIYKAHLIGHSMGGKTAMKFALEYPDMVEKLIVVDMSPAAYPPGHDEIFKALLAVDVAGATSRAEVEAQLKKGIPSLAVRQFLMKNLSRSMEGGFEWKFNLQSLFDNYAQILEAVSSNHTFDNETLFIRGEKSGYVHADNEAVIKDLFPDYKIATIKNAGHWIHAEAPEPFLKEVRSFLQ